VIRRRTLSLFVFVSLVVGAFGIPGHAAGRAASNGPSVGRALAFERSMAVRTLSAGQGGGVAAAAPSRINPLEGAPDQSWRDTWQRAQAPTDPLIAPARRGGVRGPATPSPDFGFLGVRNPFGCGGCSPPDTNGDVSPNNYIQIVNATKVAIFTKAGALVQPPFNLGSLWSSGICRSNAGDPVVLYDGLADRWFLTQFASPSHVCVALSTSPVPTGTYNLYTFNVGQFPDYLKFGVWPDAYYMGANQSSYTSYAFDRAKMLAGDPLATFVRFTGQTNFLLPADVDGPTPPPAGSPGYFYTFKDNSFHGGQDRIEVFAFHVDFVNPNLSTFVVAATIPVAPFTYTVCGFFNFDCVRQSGTQQRIDVVSEWPMHRFPYRNFGDHQTLLGNFTVGGGLGQTGAAIRWFELRNTGTGWTLYQQGTHDPGDGNDRFMGSIAMDGAGDIAIGYSVSSSAIHPSIRYATRVPSDPLGTLEPEAVMINAGGSQTGSNRWGDYSSMTVDPASDCRFWYTNEFYSTNSGSNWKTAVGVFTMPNC
jgi:hypothetical protein